MSGPQESLSNGWKLIRQNLRLEEPAPANLYLGCLHEKIQVKTAKGSATGMVYDMEDYLTSTVDSYLALANKVTGQVPALRSVNTPFLPEDHHNSPARKPCSDGPTTTCPWCKHTFSDADDGTKFGATVDPTAAGEGGSGTTLENEQGGVLQPIAASALMKVLYVARMARFDLLRAVCRLACFVTKWTFECDKKLFRLICYINSTKHLRMVGWVGDEPGDITRNLYADADFAGCDKTQRSTTGVHMAMEGPSTKYPISGISRRQGSISCSTPEAKLVAGHTAYKNVLLPSISLWDILLPTGYVAMFNEDNQAMINVVKSGRNPSMRHLSRTHGIPIDWLHERLKDHKDPVEIVYRESEEMAADIYTKAFTDKEKWQHACALINHVPNDMWLKVDKQGNSELLNATTIKLSANEIPKYICRNRIQWSTKFATLTSKLNRYWPYVIRRVTTDLNRGRVLADETIANLSKAVLTRPLPVHGRTDIKVEFYTSGTAPSFILTNAADEREAESTGTPTIATPVACSGGSSDSLRVQLPDSSVSYGAKFSAGYDRSSAEFSAGSESKARVLRAKGVMMLDVAAKSIGLSATSDDQYVLSKSAGAYLMEICREVSAILEADDKTRQDNNTKQN